ncbi:phosphotransferase enzyme family protein [Rhodoligotrophos defluvii]|uniref:phosphotransferase enzyme family protein n=1 Tax=Rhodoligotrophos defluvii TaxID=2561934 RepID=UPI0010C9D735|nr:phosphotransferase [Rhodoligotrophos defluvii]
MSNALTTEGLREAIDELAAAALPRWGIEGADLTLINHSENWTYRVTPPDAARPVILRVHRDAYHTTDGIRSELAWMRALQSEAGVKTPQAITASDGADIQWVEHPAGGIARNCVLFEFIDGAEPSHDNLAPSFRQLGEVTARCHNHSQTWQRPPYFERLCWDFEHSFGARANWGRWQDGPDCTPDRERLLQRAVDLMQRRLERFGKGRERYGLIHADFRLANLLVHNGDVRVIDFDDCGLGWFLYDAATAVSFFEDRADVPELMEAWKDGYRRCRTLPKEDEDELWTFILMRRMTLFAWMGSHSETELARTEGPGYSTGTCELAERYLSQYS